jgi:hypothetical protein
MMCAMSDTSNGDGRADQGTAEPGVLANLPRTRPQRSSPRRAAARKAATATPAKPRGLRTTARPSPGKARAKRDARTAPRVEEPAPRQGFEADGEIASGPVQPPGATELVSSAAELAGELAKAGVTGGARLLKDLFSRLPG